MELWNLMTYTTSYTYQAPEGLPLARLLTWVDGWMVLFGICSPGLSSHHGQLLAMMDPPALLMLH